MLIQIQRNALIVVLMQHIKFNKDLNVLNNVQKIMLIQKVEIFVIILVTIIKLQNNINNVYNNVQKIIISFINIIIDMNVFNNVININIIMRMELYVLIVVIMLL